MGSLVPPSSLRLTPVKYPFCMIAATKSANSSGFPNLPRAEFFKIAFSTFSGIACAILVRNNPGMTVTTRMLNFPNSRLIGSVMAMMAPLLAEYAVWPCCPSSPATDATFTITPAFCLCLTARRAYCWQTGVRVMLIVDLVDWGYEDMGCGQRNVSIRGF